MKKFTRTTLTLLLSLLFVCCSGCTSHYKSKYNAVNMITSNNSTSCSIKFEKLSGVYVSKLKGPNNSDGAISYTASLEKGEMNVYYDASGTKELLFNIKAGESIENDLCGYWTNGAAVYIILETVSECEGSLKFSLIYVSN